MIRIHWINYLIPILFRARIWDLLHSRFEQRMCSNEFLLVVHYETSDLHWKLQNYLCKRNTALSNEWRIRNHRRRWSLNSFIHVIHRHRTTHSILWRRLFFCLLFHDRKTSTASTIWSNSSQLRWKWGRQETMLRVAQHLFRCIHKSQQRKNILSYRFLQFFLAWSYSWHWNGHKICVWEAKTNIICSQWNDLLRYIMSSLCCHVSIHWLEFILSNC